MADVITIGLSEIMVGTASPEGNMPEELKKIGKTDKDSGKFAHDTSDVTEHYEECYATP